MLHLSGGLAISDSDLSTPLRDLRVTDHRGGVTQHGIVFHMRWKTLFSTFFLIASYLTSKLVTTVLPQQVVWELAFGLFRTRSRAIAWWCRPRKRGSGGSWLDQRFSAAMGCCSMDTLVSGCCCCNAAIVLPPKIGCRGDIMVCCADVTCCFDLGSICNPGACCCCGPTCKCNTTLCKLKCTVFCFDVQGSCPCDSDTPIICTLLPCCTIYPRSACCATRASIVKKPKASDAPKNETMDRGSPPRKGLQVV